MPDRAKVMKALDLCSKGKELLYCDECPYKIDDYTCDSKGLAADALFFLKECDSCADKTSNAIQNLQAKLKVQEPRVMTLDETIASCENPVWLEENTLQGSYGAWGVVKGVREKYNAVTIGGVRFGYWPRAKYNISWRCWTERPTEEQRKAVKWE